MLHGQAFRVHHSSFIISRGLALVSGDFGATAPRWRQIMTEQVKEAPAQTAELTVTDKLRLLLDITKKISRSLDLHEVLNLVMDTLDSLIHYDAAGIYILKCR